MLIIEEYTGTGTTFNLSLSLSFSLYLSLPLSPPLSLPPSHSHSLSLSVSLSLSAYNETEMMGGITDRQYKQRKLPLLCTCVYLMLEGNTLWEWDTYACMCGLAGCFTTGSSIHKEHYIYIYIYMYCVPLWHACLCLLPWLGQQKTILSRSRGLLLMLTSTNNSPLMSSQEVFEVRLLGFL